MSHALLAASLTLLLTSGLSAAASGEPTTTAPSDRAAAPAALSAPVAALSPEATSAPVQAAAAPDTGTAAPPRAYSPFPDNPWRVELSTLRLLHAKGLLSQTELELATRAAMDSGGLLTLDGATVSVSKWALTFYGFLEARALYDTTQSFNEQEGNGAVARPGTFAAAHDRFQLSSRNSRFGLRLKAPEWKSLRASAVMELDFLGVAAPLSYGQPYSGSEGALFTSPGFRARHLYLKVETPYVDVLAGQYWSLFGGQGTFQPNTFEMQGLPGQVYVRTPQVRLSKTLKSELATLEMALGAARAPQRDSGLPDGQAGLKLSLNKWSAWTTPSWTGSLQHPASLSVSGMVRSLRVSEFTAAPATSTQLTAGGVAVDLLLPLLSGTKEKHGGALTLVGEFVWGRGIVDQYSGFTGGVGLPALPNPAGVTPAPTWPQNLDSGLIAFDANLKPNTVQWSTAFGNLQYVLPVCEGRVWLSTVFARAWSTTTPRLGQPKARAAIDYLSATVSADVLPSVRLAVEYDLSLDHSVDEVTATNHRVQLGAAFIF